MRLGLFSIQHVRRPDELGTLEITVTPRGSLTPERAAQWAELGVDRLVVRPRPTAGVADIERVIDESAEAVAAVRT
jgi:hypothetical protein